MKTVIVLASVIACLVVIAGCGDAESQHAQQATQDQPDPEPVRPPTPEEELGLEEPGKLAASVEAWAGSNELGDYFRQSRERLSRLHAQLIEDYNVRKESELEATDFTRETLRKYHEAYDADSTLRQFMVECYSRKEVLPLPPSIEGMFSTRIGEREKIRRIREETPVEIVRLTTELDALKSELAAAGVSTWLQEKELNVWRDLQIRVGEISSRANNASAQASALTANMVEVVRENGGAEDAEELKGLNDKAEQVKADISSFAVRASQQLEIVNGQMLIEKFADDCKTMAEGIAGLPKSLAKKRARQAEIKDLVSRIIASRTRGYSDLDMLAQQAGEIKARSRSAGEGESSLGKRIQGMARSYEQFFGSAAIYRLKRELPEPSAQARIDAYLASFRRAVNVPSSSDPSGFFTGIESKAYQLADRMEEETMLKQLDDTLLAVKRLAARRR